jgi:hypothetical protein
MSWQDISTAPKDGRSVLCYVPLPTMSRPDNHRVLVLRWDDGEYRKRPAEWRTDVNAFVPFKPSHWQPLPEPPQSFSPSPFPDLTSEAQS